MNWGMGSTIGVVLIVAMVIIMWLTGGSGKRHTRKGLTK